MHEQRWGYHQLRVSKKQTKNKGKDICYRGWEYEEERNVSQNGGWELKI